MKKVAILLMSLFALPAYADGVFIGAFLRGFSEVPSVNSKAFGTFEAGVSNDLSTISYELEFFGLQAPVQQAHIHFAQKRVNGPVIVWLCGTPAIPGPAGTPPCPQSGTVRGTITAANVLASPTTQQLPAGDIADLVRAMVAGVAYVNVHTAVSPGGEIRGQTFRLF
jgi:hypothetical protein